MSNIQALHVFMKTPLTNQMVQSLVNSTLKVLPSCSQSSYPSPPSSPTNSLPSLYMFINNLVKYTNVFTGTLMASLVYLKRLNEKLPHGATAQDPSSRHRIFLACLILSAKFHNDASPKNKHWAKYTDGLFSTNEINEMERQLLFLLDWDVTVSNEDLIFVLKDFLTPIKQELKNSIKINNFLKQQHRVQNRVRPNNFNTSAGYKSFTNISASKSLPKINTAPVATLSHIRKVPSMTQLDSLPPLPAYPINKQINYNTISYARNRNNSATPSSVASLTSTPGSAYCSSPEDELFLQSRALNEPKVSLPSDYYEPSRKHSFISRNLMDIYLAHA